MSRNLKFLPALLWPALLLPVAGCGTAEPVAAATDRQTAFLCTETSDVFAADAIDQPGINPRTGRPTLVPGLYCERCAKWYPSPPRDLLQRTPGAGRCPRTGGPLALTGPLPTPAGH